MRYKFKYKLCLTCGALNHNISMSHCWRCGSEELSDQWEN